jgi:hypothetical protein
MLPAHFVCLQPPLISSVRLLVEELPALTAELIESRLVLCASGLGYLEESGRYEVRDSIVPECAALVHMLRSASPDGEARALRLAQNHPVPWVRYYAAVSLARDFPNISSTVYKDLQLVGGFVAAAALLAEKFLAQPKH